MRPSDRALAHGEAMSASLIRDLQRCRHPQAEPVILSTGEQVASVCIGCYHQLPAEYIHGQAEKAHREAYCTHDNEVDITGFGQVEATTTCIKCGRIHHG